MRNFKEIKKYVSDSILPQYRYNDNAHNVEHIEYVINRSLRFSKKYNCDACVLYVAAAYHDIGHSINPDNHEKISAEIFANDNQIKKWFSKTEINLISEAIEDHRSSNANMPRSIYGEILSSADRSTNVLGAIKRSVYYNRHYLGRAKSEIVLSNVCSYIIKKYGVNGYSKSYVNDVQYCRFIKKMIFLSKHPQLLETIIKIVILTYYD